MPPRLGSALPGLAAAALAILLLSGCGLAPNRPASNVNLVVSEDFGAKPLVQTDQPRRAASDTLQALLKRNASIDPRAHGASLFVNGIAAKADTRVRDGDHVWWDRHLGGARVHVPAVVGAFPEPFVHGAGGKRLPVRLECGAPQGADCDTVSKALVDLGLVPGRGQLGGATGTDTVRVLVGTWPQVRVDDSAEVMQNGPRSSGVYVRVAPDGRSMTPLDASGRASGTLGAGTGLIAATQLTDEAPTWIVSGTDAAGLTAAAQAFAEGETTLSDKFALAIHDGRGIALPAR